MGFDSLSTTKTTVFTTMYNQGVVSANLFSFYLKRLFFIIFKSCNHIVPRRGTLKDLKMGVNAC
jgi:hypothetical protein